MAKTCTREEGERRREVADCFQATINDVTIKMQEQQQHNQQLKAENVHLANKLWQLLQHYEAKENQFEDILKHKELELQLCEALVSAADGRHGRDKGEQPHGEGYPLTASSRGNVRI